MSQVKQLIFSIVFLGIPMLITAQADMPRGKVLDVNTKEPLAFVNILINQGPYGTTTDIDGRFSVESKKPVYHLYFTYMGYKPVHVEVSAVEFPLTVQMEPKEIELSAVEITPGMNPANRIIRKTIANKATHNPDNLNSYSYTSYDKMVFTINQDSLAKIKKSAVDSTYKNMKEFFDKQHLFLMETASEVKYKNPGKRDEKVTASRVSGLKDPLFIFLISQMQSTSFYDDLIKISDKHYVNPISKGSLDKYHFRLQDTLFKAGSPDTTFVITYNPLRNKNFDGLKGLLHINTHGYAIENVIAEPARKEGGISMKIRQKYELIDGRHWFPVQLRTQFVLNNVKVGPLSPVGTGTSYITDIKINPGLSNKDFDNVVVDTEQDAYERSNKYWKRLRHTNLDEKERETYRVIDSIGEAQNLDRKLQSFQILTEGKLPLGIFSLELDKLVHYNDYEGWYLGLGGRTNKRFSKTITLGGYWGYGFKDNSAKYGGEAEVLLHRPSELSLNLEYRNDLTESGAITDFKKIQVLNDAWLRNYLVERFDHTEAIRAGVSFRWLQYLETSLALSKSSKDPQYGYGYSPGITEILYTTFDLTQISAGMRFAWGEEFIRNGQSKMSLGTDYPVLWLKYTRGINGFLEGDYEMNRYDLQLGYSHYFRFMGKSSIQLNAGYIQGDVPATNLYNGHGSYRKFSVFAPNSFATMRMNEFLSDRFVSAYFTHNFGKLLFRTENFAPDILFATNVGFGKLTKNNNHIFKKNPNTLEKGYYESGLLINNLIGSGFTGVGFGAFYRYGPYGLDDFSDNISLKISLSLMF
ncbi:MAG: DUF5686 and carboxypeptidase regulatory-like domain-containing protein [Bacteroidales bacterium]|nr:DUF5686 and carboxypeptidase regulatory-like domain-containing protein [Bacteroidales bacterium]